MLERINNLEKTVGIIDRKVDKIADSVYILRDEIGDLRGEFSDLRGEFSGLGSKFSVLKNDVGWMKWIMGVGAAAIVSIGIYFANRQNVLSDQIAELIKQLAK